MAKRDVRAFLATARERFRQAAEAEREIREEAEKDLLFVAGEQWEEKDRVARERAGRPALTHNRLPAFVQQVTNEARQTKPQIKFSPVENADEDTAKVFEGIARHIQYDSKASVAYETALEYSASCSFGYYRLLTDYCSHDGFDQEIKVGPIHDPFSVYGVLIPALLGQPCRWAFVCDSLTEEDYKAAYPNSELVSLNFEGTDAGDWVAGTPGARRIRIAEYWHTDTVRKTIAELADGSVVDAAKVPEGVEVKRTREVDVPTVHVATINGAEILEETDWAASEIGIIPVLGKSLIVRSKPRLFSLVRFMRDPQQLINYAKSRIAETLATAPISPYIGQVGQFAGREKEWAQSNTVPTPFLQYNRVDVNGQPAPAPQRQVYEPPIAALSAFLMQEIDELKAISGIFDASLGNKGPAESGIAIARQQQQSNATNLHFIDNLGRAHEQGGRIIAELIPKIYDGERMVRILGEDESRRVVKVNQLYIDETGQQRSYDLSAGKYDVVVTTGRAWSTKRLETFDSLTSMVQAYPQLMQIVGDIIFRNSDLAGADEISERMKAALPPGLATDKDKPQKLPPQVQAQLQQMGQMIEQLTGALNEAQHKIETRQLELGSKERIELERIQVQREELQARMAIEQAKLGSQESIVHLQEELAVIRHQMELQQAAAAAAAEQSVAADDEELPRAA